LKKKREPKELTIEAALEKARRFCNYQERCTSEVNQRLKDWNVTGTDAEKIINDLVENDLVNEERFAKAFARGKFRVKGWGTQKIQSGLRAKKISNEHIQAALSELPQTDQDNTLQQLLEKKNKLLKETNPLKRKVKLGNYAMQKGYRGEKVWKAIAALVAESKS
jgi:regulatory protein